jgi:multicomponent Na+:H+ antiporter subunit E
VSFFLWNILLAVNWALLTGQFNLENLAGGFVIGFLLLWVLRQSFGQTDYFPRVRNALVFSLTFMRDLLLSNLSVARTVLLEPRDKINPAFLAIPLDAKTDAEIALLANLITLTPGTLSLDVSTDRSVLYIHTLDVEDVDALRDEVKRNLERGLLEVMR